MNIWIMVLVTFLTGYVSPYQQFPSAKPNNWQKQPHNSTGLFSEVESRLKALEAAHEAGILTDAEYTSKKAELEAQLRTQLDEATKQKLAALEAAHQAGILSDEEYERKKAELLGQTPVVQTPMSRYQDPQGRFQFQYPGSWGIQNLQDGAQGVSLTRGKAALNIMPLPDGVADPQQVVAGISQQIGGQWQNYVEIRLGELNVGGQPAPMVEFSGVNPEGMQAHGQAAAYVSGIKGYLFILIAPENDPENSFNTVQPAWKLLLSSFALTAKKGKVYKHTAGFSFQYPDDWSVTEQEGVVQLVPTDAASTAEGPMELYFVATEDISEYGIQRPDDPMILEYLDQQVLSLSPALQRTGATSRASMRSGQGVIVNWGATGTGGEVIARAYVGIIKSNVVILLGMGLKERVESRDQVLRQVFNSLGVGDPQPVVNTAMSGATQAGQASTGMTASSTISAGEAGDLNWGFKFLPPPGWKFQKTNEYILLGHDTIAGAIFVLPHIEAGLQAVQAQMQSGLSEEGVQLFPAGAVQPFGNNAVAGEYSGVADGQQVKARGIGTFSPYGGGGAYIVAMTIPDKYGTELSSAADAIARGMQYFKVEVADLMQHFAGTWASATTYTLTNITLGADGSYDDTYEAAYSGDLTDGTFKTGDWATTGQEQSKGRWTVRGDKQQGVIIIKYSNGNEENLQYKVHVEKGETYWREYWFNGKHYRKIR